MENQLRVLGIDPGSHRTGWGVIDCHGSRLIHVASGTVQTNFEPLAERLKVIANELDHILQTHHPQAVSVESVFHARNARSALLLGHARGVALLCAARQGIPVFEYSAGQIKQAATGRGRADKEQVQEMVWLILGPKTNTQPSMLDTSDALAAAICHAHLISSPAAKLIQQAKNQPKCTRHARLPIHFRQIS